MKSKERPPTWGGPDERCTTPLGLYQSDGDKYDDTSKRKKKRDKHVSGPCSIRHYELWTYYNPKGRTVTRAPFSHQAA